jgi:hypothetical protein
MFIAGNLLNVLKGGAYLIASSILQVGLLGVLAAVLLGYLLSDKPHTFSIELLFIFLPLLFTMFAGAAGISGVGRC